MLRPSVEELTSYADFTFDRLRSFYLQNLQVAKKPYDALAEAKLLFKESHHTAAFIHAAIASEVAIKAYSLANPSSWVGL